MPVSTAPDGGLWAWLAVVGCFMGNLIGDGVMYSFGIFLPEFKRIFNCGSGEVSTINSIQMGVTFASGPIASYMTNALGWRLTTVIGSVLCTAGLCFSAVAPNVGFLYFSAGGLLGLGLGIIYLPRLDCITQYFDKRRPIVTGIAICGSGLGTFIFAPLTELLLHSYDWTIVLLILGGICLLNCGFGMMFAPLPKINDDESITCESLGDTSETLLKGNSNQEETMKDTLKEMLLLLRNWAFMMFAVSNFLTSLGYPIPYTFVPDNAELVGLSKRQGAYLVGLIGISNTVARVILGAMSQKMNRLFLYNTCLLICGITMGVSNFIQPLTAAVAGVDCDALLSNSSVTDAATILVNTTDSVDMLNSTTADLPWVCDHYIGQFIYVNCYGVTSAAYVLLTTLVLADLLGADKFTNSFGLLLLFQGVATFIGPPIVGFMFDTYGTYNEGFILMGTMIALSGIMLYPIPCIKNYLGKDLKCVSERELNDPEAERLPVHDEDHSVSESSSFPRV